MAFRPIARLDQISPRFPTRIEFAPNDSPYAIAIFRVGDELLAVEDRCTHQDYPLSEGDVRGEEVTCPLHGACFNLRTGIATCGPCNGPVRTFPLRIVGDQVEVDLAPTAATEA